MISLVIFVLDDQKIAIDVNLVERVVLSVFVTALPGLSRNLMGIINVKGDVVPVANLRKMLSFPERDIELDDCIVIASGRNSSLAFVVDSIDGVVHVSEEQLSKVETTDNIFVSGVLDVEGDLLLLIDPKTVDIDLKMLKGMAGSLS